MLGRRVMVNSLTALLTNVVLIVAGFLLQRVMVSALGTANIGLNSVFTNIISILSLAELGISTAIVFHLYAPLAAHNEALIRELMRLYAKAYRTIALVVLALGLCVTPFVHIFLKDSPFPLDYIRLIFLLFLARTVSSYLLSYRRSLIMADQRTHIVSIVDLVSQVLSMGVGILILSLTQSFVWYLISCTFFTIAGNVAIAVIVRRLYPYMRTRSDEPIDPALRSVVFGDVKNVFVMKISGVILTSTDSVIISSFVGVVAAGLYSNYYLVIQSLLTLVAAVTNAIQPTLGDMYARQKMEELDGVLRNYTFTFYLLGAAIACELLCLLTPFVTQVWLGADCGLEFPVVCLLVTNFFLLTLRNPLWSLLTVSGLFAKDKNISIAGATTNLIVSLALVMPLGIFGVLIGTFVSQMLQVVLKVRLLYRDGLHGDAKPYAKQFAQYFALFFAQAALCFLLCGGVSFEPPLLCLLVKALLCLVPIAAVNLAIFGRSQRMKQMLATFSAMLKKENA